MAGLLLLMIYITFISLGLPDALLGAGWPAMYPSFGVPVSYAGAVTLVSGVGTVFSTLCCQRLIARFGTGKVCAASTALTTLAMFGYSVSGHFWVLFLFVIPMGIGAGCIDAALNNYVAVHYESRHMSWLHCMWGVGTTVGPYIMGLALSNGENWRAGYAAVGGIQAVLSLMLFFALPLWSKVRETNGGCAEEPEAVVMPLREVIRIPRVKAAALCFFLYCALEQTAGLWASSYLHLYEGLTKAAAASFAGLYFFGVTAGRAATGFMTMKYSDSRIIEFGLLLIFAGVLCLLLPLGATVSLMGFVLMGLGSAPVYPCLVHTTPARFGAERSQAVVGVQMTGAFLGSCLMPPLFGLIANHIHVAWLSVYLLALLAGLVLAFRRLETPIV